MKKLTIVLTLFVVCVIALPLTAVEPQNQAPMLEEAVADGEIPSLQERMPEEPLVMDVWHDIGQYGGTWNRITDSESYYAWRRANYDNSFVKWVDDGADITPNLITDWEYNDDMTEWTVNFREGIRWSDGGHFDVDDVLFWWEDLVLDDEFPEAVPEWALTGEDGIANLEKIDNYTLQISFEEPEPLLLERWAMFPDGGVGDWNVAPKHYLEDFHPNYTDQYEDYDAIIEEIEWWTNPDIPTLNAWVLVEEAGGERAVYERNPYYWAVDAEGNQLPYIDRVEIDFVADREVLKLRKLEGEADFQVRLNAFSAAEIPMVIDSAENNNFEAYIISGGSGSVMTYYPNLNHEDPDKRELYRTPEFRQALSHAINREQMNDAIYFGMGYETTGTFNHGAAEYHSSEKGERLFEEWRDAYLYNPERAEELLDKLGVVDQTGDGWRDLPNGEELVLRIDMNVGSRDAYYDMNEMTSSYWQEIGLQTDINTVSGGELVQMNRRQTYDIHGSRGNEEGPNHIIFPQWLVPIDNVYWGALEGSYYLNRAINPITEEEEDMDPRDRTPPRKIPEEGGVIDQLQDLYDSARVETDELARHSIVHDMIEIHINEGPLWIGTLGDTPTVGVLGNHFKNVPAQEELGFGGRLYATTQAYIGQLLPPQFYIEE